jgi:hypothetical protein
LKERRDVFVVLFFSDAFKPVSGQQLPVKLISILRRNFFVERDRVELLLKWINRKPIPTSPTHPYLSSAFNSLKQQLLNDSNKFHN